MAMKIRPLSNELRDVTTRELNEIPGQIEENLEHLKDWLSKQEYLKARTDDQLLLSFLRGSKHSLQRTKEKLDAYYTFRTMAPEISKNLDPYLPSVQAFLKAGLFVPLPIAQDDPGSARVLLARFGQYDALEVPVVAMLQSSSIMLDILINEDDNFAVAGVKAVIDMKGLQLKTAFQITPSVIYNIAYLLEKAYPARLKTVYFINIPKYLEPILSTFKLVVSSKFAQRLHFYSTENWDEIYKDIPKSILPSEYGGFAGCHNDIAADWKKTVESHCKRLVEERNYYSDESKRLGNSNVDENVFGMDGSFRKFNID